MNHRSLSLIGMIFIWLACSAANVNGQQAGDVEAKKALILEFRKLTGADNVNFGLDITLDGAKKELLDMVQRAEGISGDHKQALEKTAAEAGARLDVQLKSFLDDRSKFVDVAESAIFEMYDKAFTADELRQLIAFYKTDIGQRGLKFLRNQNTEFEAVFRGKVMPMLSDFIKPKIKA